MIQYIPYRWVEFVQIYLNRHTIPVKLNKTWKQVKEKKGREEMKSKKLISLLCAAAMSASAFAGLTVTASAADDLFTLTDFTASRH